MTSENSPIIEYYPPDFKTDLNGKQQEWEAVVLIPFIDEVHKQTHTYKVATPVEAVFKHSTRDRFHPLCVCGLSLLFYQRYLLAAMETCNHNLTKAEKNRNCHTECAVYWHDPEKDFKYSSSLPQIFPDIVRCHARFEDAH